jgi:hypothetical protein
MAVNVAVVKNLVAAKGSQVAVNFGEGGSEGLPRSGNTGQTLTLYCLVSATVRDKPKDPA